MKLPARNFIIRTLSGVVFAAVVVGCILISEITFGILLLLICGGCMYEFYGIAREAGISPLGLFGIVSGATLLTVNFLGEARLMDMSLATHIMIGTAILVIFLPFFAELYRKKTNPIYNTTFLNSCLDF